MSALSVPNTVGGIALHTAGIGAEIVTGHTVLTESGGIATPVNALNPLPITVAQGVPVDGSGPVGLASTPMLAADASRRELVLMSIGAADLAIGFGAPVTWGSGAFLLASGPAIASPAGYQGQVLHAGGSILVRGAVAGLAVYAMANGAGGLLSTKGS